MRRAVLPLAAVVALAGCDSVLGISDHELVADGGESETSSGSSSGDDAGGCALGTQECSGTGIATCGANGQWGSPWPCATGACSNGACTGSTTGSANPSCAPGGAGMDDCSAGTGRESCCTSFEVAGGTYHRTYKNEGSGPYDEADPASVSGLRLDVYLVTVGRFRQFVNVALARDGGTGWSPPPGSGKHEHLNGRQGLANSGSPEPYESGWLMSDSSQIGPTDANLACDPTFATWTHAPAGQEALPINCVNWYEAYAFCIWDGGFLPSETEWEYAAVGGSQQREYPWGHTPPGTTNQYAVYDCSYPISGMGICNAGNMNIAPVGTATLGVGLWGQLDMAGELFEWTRDWYSSYVDPCADCAYLTVTANHPVRGGFYGYNASWLIPTTRPNNPPTDREDDLGFRCARVP